MSPSDAYRALGALRDDLDRIDKAALRLRRDAPELIRRGNIPANRDGYPRRASGAQPALAIARPAIHTWAEVADASSWAWRCDCGTEGHQWPSQHTAAAAGQQHRLTDCDCSNALDYADPTGETAVTPLNGHDPVTRHSHNLVRAVERAARHLDRALDELAAAHRIPRDPHDPSCESCARILHDDGRPWLSAIHPRVPNRTDVAGRLPKPRYLCRWCYDAVPTFGGLPPRDLVREHLEVGYVRRSA